MTTKQSYRTACLLAACLLPASQGLAVDLETYEYDDRPSLGQVPSTEDGNPLTDIYLGGFSGLYFAGINEGDPNRLVFVTHPDRGPNGDPTNLLPDVPGNERPFPIPDFQAEITTIEVNRTTGDVTLLDRLPLFRENGIIPITGRPNLPAGSPNIAHTDEAPVNAFGQPLLNDPYGADMEGIVIDPRDGSYWMSDEYRPAVYHFNSDGNLIDRFIPEGTAASAGQAEGAFGTELFPEVYAQRRRNRGFEALAMNTDTNKLYAFIQSPIDNPESDPGSPSDANSRASDVIRILELDTTGGNTTVTGEYVYLLENDDFDSNVDKIGDAVWLGDDTFAVIQRDSGVGENANKPVFKIDLAGATNTLGETYSKELEAFVDEVDLANDGITPVSKEFLFDLPEIGYLAGDKPEGLALLPDINGQLALAVINDNDFGLAGDDLLGDGTVPFSSDPTPVIVGIVTNIPEPGSMALLAMGSLLIAARRRRG